MRSNAIPPSTIKTMAHHGMWKPPDGGGQRPRQDCRTNCRTLEPPGSMPRCRRAEARMTEALDIFGQHRTDTTTRGVEGAGATYEGNSVMVCYQIIKSTERHLLIWQTRKNPFTPYSTNHFLK